MFENTAPAQDFQRIKGIVTHRFYRIARKFGAFSHNYAPNG